MQVSVYHDEILIGTAIIKYLDQGMGVAFGSFSPSGQYDRDKHASTIEGDYIGDKGRLLSVHAAHHGTLNIASLAIQDWADPDVGKELIIWLRDSADFALFLMHHD